MQLYNLKEMLIRVIIAIQCIIPPYMIYLCCNVRADVSRISFIIVVLASLLGFGINLIKHKAIKESLMSKLIVAAGIIVSVILGFRYSTNMNLFSFAGVFVLVLWVWNRSIKVFYEDYVYLYSIGQFYRNILLLALIDIVCVYSKPLLALQSQMTSYTIMYIVIAVFVLFETRDSKYKEETKNKKATYDVLFTFLILGISFIMSTEKALKVTGKVFGSIYQSVFGMLFKVVEIITRPIIYLLNIIFLRIHLLIRNTSSDPIASLDATGKINHESANDIIYTDLDAVKVILNTLTITLMIIITLVLVYFIYTNIDRFVKKRSDDEFEEDREFAMDVKLPKLSGALNGIKNKMVNTYKNATFNLTSNNREKLRHEYKSFLAKMYEKKLLEDKNLTAQEVEQILNVAYPASIANMSFITKLYEEVRYGDKTPDGDELKIFKIKIMEFTKAID